MLLFSANGLEATSINQEEIILKKLCHFLPNKFGFVAKNT